MDNITQANSFFKDDIFATVTTGIETVEVHDKYAKCKLKINKSHLNAANSVMGGAIYTLADFTFAVAANSIDKICVTLTSSISYLSGAKGDTLYAESQCVKWGKSTCFYTIHITDNLSNAVADVSTTGYFINKK